MVSAVDEVQQPELSSSDGEMKTMDVKKIKAELQALRRQCAEQNERISKLTKLLPTTKASRKGRSASSSEASEAPAEIDTCSTFCDDSSMGNSDLEAEGPSRQTTAITISTDESAKSADAVEASFDTQASGSDISSDGAEMDKAKVSAAGTPEQQRYLQKLLAQRERLAAQRSSLLQSAHAACRDFKMVQDRCKAQTERKVRISEGFLRKVSRSRRCKSTAGRPTAAFGPAASSAAARTGCHPAAAAATNPATAVAAAHLAEAAAAAVAETSARELEAVKAKHQSLASQVKWLSMTARDAGGQLENAYQAECALADDNARLLSEVVQLMAAKGAPVAPAGGPSSQSTQAIPTLRKDTWEILN